MNKANILFLFVVLSVGLVTATTIITDDSAIMSGNFTTTGNVSASYFVGDGSLLTGINNSNSTTWWSSLSSWLPGWFVDNSGVLEFNETKLNLTIDARENDTTYSHLSNFTDDILWTTSFNTTGDSRWSGGIDTQKNASGYLYNDSTTIYLNESLLNGTIDLRDSDTTYNFQCSAGQFVKNLTSEGSYVCDTPVGGSSYLSKYSSGNFNGSLYTTGANSSLSNSNSIFQIIGSDGTPRFQVQNGGDNQASFIARSFMIVNQNDTRLNQSQNNLCSEWGFEFIDCNTSITGADMGVQDDFEVQGLMYSSEGLYGETSDWGAYVFMGNLNSIGVSESSGAFTDANNYFCDYSASPFLQTHEDNNNWVKIKSGTYEGAVAEISVYVNSSCVELSNNPSWNINLNSQNYELIEAPIFSILDGGFGEFYVGDNSQSKFQIKVNNGTGNTGFDVNTKSGVNQHSAATFSADTKGYDGTTGILNKVYSSVSSENIDSKSILSEFITDNFNNSHHTFIDVDIIGTKESGMEVSLIETSGDFDSYIESGEQDTITKVYYDNGAGSTTDITSFVTSESSDVDIFENDNSIIYIGSATNFTDIGVSLNKTASKDLVLEYYYCLNNGTYIQATGVSDTTSGFKSSGVVGGDNPSDRGACNQEIDGTTFANTTNYAYIAIKRTLNNVASTPIEGKFSISGSQATFILADDYIKLHGVSAPPITCEITVDGAIYYDSDVKFHCSCKAGTGWVQMNDYSTGCS